MVITAVIHAVAELDGLRMLTSKRSKPLRQPKGFVSIGRRFLSAPEREKDGSLARHQGVELSKKGDPAGAARNVCVPSPSNNEAVMRRQFRGHFVRWTEQYI